MVPRSADIEGVKEGSYGTGDNFREDDEIVEELEKKRKTKHLTVVVVVSFLVLIIVVRLIEKRKLFDFGGKAKVQMRRFEKHVDNLPHLGIAKNFPRWGIAGLGRISLDFALILNLQGGNLEAVAAGSLPESYTRAKRFAQSRGVRKWYGSYEELANDPNIDIVYIGTTNHLHCTLALLFLKAGKHVLVEKPTATNIHEVLLMINEAQKQQKLLATNFWNTAFPVTNWAEQQTASGLMGKLIAMRGDMAFQAVHNNTDRFLNAKLGGGAMLDMGCYLIQTYLHFLSVQIPQIKHIFEYSIQKNNISFISNFTSHQQISNLGQISNTGVDIENLAALNVAGIYGQFGISFQRDSPFNFEFLFSHGRLELVAPSNCPEHAYMTVRRDASTESHPPLPCCGQRDIDSQHIDSLLPPFPPDQKQQYPGTMGFAYMMHHVELCIADPHCLDLPIVPYWIQLATQYYVDQLRYQLFL
mmetsp:Transcript_13233/g.17656  ORF Transcript_13233/g.17656 Transcript_13233/m.17656 type:complete len:471 (-) Transcript_13233:365-1777(-)